MEYLAYKLLFLYEIPKLDFASNCVLNDFVGGIKMKKLLAVFLCILIGFDIFAAGWQKIDATDEFGDSNGEYYLCLFNQQGSYTSAGDGANNVTLYWDFEYISDNDDCYFILYEGNKKANLSTAKYTSDTYTVKVKRDDESTKSYKGQICRNGSVYNAIQTNNSILKEFGKNKNCKIVISANNGSGSYSLGSVDTTSYESALGIKKGEAGGYIFYDKGYYSDGWRYLEAAPSDLSGGYVWGPNGSFETKEGIGTGKENSKIIPATRDQYISAAKACLDYSINGYDDWFLPSIDELNSMNNNLCKFGLGSFSSLGYWSSSEYSSTTYEAMCRIFDDYSGHRSDRYNAFRVRAIRAF